MLRTSTYSLIFLDLMKHRVYQIMFLLNTKLNLLRNIHGILVQFSNIKDAMSRSQKQNPSYRFFFTVTRNLDYNSSNDFSLQNGLKMYVTGYFPFSICYPGAARAAFQKKIYYIFSSSIYLNHVDCWKCSNRGFQNLFRVISFYKFETSFSIE